MRSSLLAVIAFAALQYQHNLSSDIPVTETETNTELIEFSKTYTETETVKILNTNTI